MRKVDVIVDLQFGSTGKGLIAGYLAECNEYDTVVNANMPNAGHTYINGDNRKWVHKVLPNGIVSPKLSAVMIGPGSIFSLDQMLREITSSKDLLISRRVAILVHENAMVLNKSHTDHEQDTLKGISSTMQGSSAAMVEKISRDDRDELPSMVKYKPEPEHPVWKYVDIVDSSSWNDYLNYGNNILLEGAQGYSLGINAGFYPFCTSRDCTPARFLSDCQIPITMVRKVIGTARIHPIRVGSLPGSSSGGCYPDQEEISWDSIGQKPEQTTVTGRNRRIFSFSEQQIAEAVTVCQPNEVFLNFCNYDAENVQRYIDLMTTALAFYGPVDSWVKWTGWGPTFFDIEERVKA